MLNPGDQVIIDHLKNRYGLPMIGFITWINSEIGVATVTLGSPEGPEKSLKTNQIRPTLPQPYWTHERYLL